MTHDRTLTPRRIVRACRNLLWQVSVHAQMRRIEDTDPYLRKIRAIHALMRIPNDYSNRGLTLQRQSTDLVKLSPTLKIDKKALAAFTAMQISAQRDGIELIIRWAYRSVDDQSYFLLDRLRWGYSIKELLTFIAAPGYSEHHTGRAIDLLHIDNSKPFEETPAYQWLSANAASFNFFMSYPQNNNQGIIFEPWHWLHKT